MKIPRIALTVFASCALAATVFPAAYIKFDGIDGESKAKGHEKWIDLQSFNAAEAQATVRDAASGQATGKREASSGLATGKRMHKPIVFTKQVDKSSPKLAEAVAKGKVFKKVEISDGAMIYTLEDCIISSIQASPSSGGDRPMESLSLNFTKIEMTPIRQKEADVKAAAPERAKADKPEAKRAPN